MLIGGRLDNACSLNAGTCTFNNAPMYFSLNPTLAPLPSCLNGTKTPVDCEERIDPALIMTHGKSDTYLGHLRVIDCFDHSTFA